MKITVSIVHYKVPELLLHCIESLELALENIESEIIVVDNHSQDDAQNIIQKRFPKIRWIANSENIGFGKAHNQAIAQAQGEYIAILNPDVVVPQTLFQNILQWIKSTTNLGIVGVQLWDINQQFLPESKRNIPTFINALEKQLGLSFLPSNQQYYAQQIPQNAVDKVDILSGAFMMMHRERFEELNGFDPQFFMYAEDIDLSLRSVQKGWDNYYLGSEILLHLKGKSAQKNPESQFHFYYTMKQFIDKHYSNSFSRFWYKKMVDLAYWKARNFS